MAVLNLLANKTDVSVDNKARRVVRVVLGSPVGAAADTIDVSKLGLSKIAYIEIPLTSGVAVSAVPAITFTQNGSVLTLAGAIPAGTYDFHGW